MVCTFGGKEMNDNANNPFIEGGFNYSTEPTHICHLQLKILTNSHGTWSLEEAANKYDDFDARIDRICQRPIMRHKPIITLSTVPEERRHVGSLLISYDIIAGKDGFSSDLRDRIIGEFREVAFSLATQVNSMFVILEIDGRKQFYYRQ